MKIYRIASTRRERDHARDLAHNSFDKLWQDPEYGFTREEAYAAMAEAFGLKLKNAHMSKFDVKRCQIVVEWADQIMRDLDRLDKDLRG